MKSRILVVFAIGVFILLGIVIAVAAENRDHYDNTNTITGYTIRDLYNGKRPISNDNLDLQIKDDFDHDEYYRTRFAGEIYKDKNEQVAIYPYASMKALLGYNANDYILGLDSSRWEITNVLPTELFIGWGVLKEAPDAIMREREDGSRYLIIDSDEGCRWFFMMGPDWQQFGSPVLVGFPLLCKNKLSCNDFKELSVGQTMADVEAIDDVCKYYRQCWFGETYNFKSADFEACYSEGRAFASIHYLKDGLLKIEYGSINENGEPVICNIEYYLDYKMKSCTDKIVDYSINELDLP